MRRPSILRRIGLPLIVGAGLLFAALADAIVVAPHHVFLDPQTRSGVLYLHNAGPAPEEASIEFVFGYPVSDSVGDVSVCLMQHPDSTEPSMAGWLRAFPRRTLVGPGETRTVRLLLQPPADLPEGEYWTRAVVTSRAARVAEATPDTGGVRVGLTLEVRTVIPVTYRKGRVTTGAVLTKIDHALRGDSLSVRVGMRRLGNAAFLGTLHVTLEDASGAVVARAEREIAIYHELLRRLTLPVADLPAGTYTLRVRLDTERSDLDPELVLEAQPVETTEAVQLP